MKLYMPDSMQATWIMLIDPKSGDVRATYVEPEIIVSQTELTAATPCPK